MEFDCNNVDENEKYAFLLGSAIKNEDSDQFFSIYDSIIPKDLPDSQIQDIKKRVSEILDLPEEEFNELVSKARSYSLASAGTSTMSCRESSDNTWKQHGTFLEVSEDEGLGSATQSQVRGAKSETSSQYSTAKCSAWSSESETHKYDEDQVLCNSSKATNSINSLSDQDGSDCEGKSYFNYYPAKIRYPPQVKITSGLGLSLDYDEAYEVKSEHSSHDDVTSPRSDISEGIEMVTMDSGSQHFSVDDDDLSCSRRGTSMDQDDFNTDGESDSEDQRMRNLYNQGYRPLMKETKGLTTSKYATSYYSDRTSSSLHYPEVDHPISFSSLKSGTSKYSRHSPYDDYGSTSGLAAGTKDVTVEKNSYKNRRPFGGREQFHKVANSIDSLIKSVPDHEVKNMPEGRKLEMLTPEENKKKKKKKKKDEVGTDQNGNPLVKDLHSYRPMRDSPSSSEGTAGNYQNVTKYGTVQYGPYTNEQSSQPKEDDPSSRMEKHNRKRWRNKQKEIAQKSEDVQNYVGDKLAIEDLVDFIDGQNVSLKKSKKQSPSNTEDIPNKSQKQNKKSKDKKQKSPTPSIDEVETKGDSSAQSAILDQQVGLNNMGNLSGKTEENASIENGDTDGNYAKKEKLPKSLLKDDRKLVVSDTVLANHHIQHSSSKAVHCKESVKDKEVPKTNIKRVAASESGTGDLKQKKGSEKLNKASKLEKVDMPISKSENTMKIDTSVAVNNTSVKQKNSKNKKSKPTSPTVKVGNEVQKEEFFNNDTLISHILDRNIIDDTGFIFTDLDVPEVPKEDEFQVVGKKKKKPAKEINQPYQQNNYINNGNRYGKRYEDKGRSNSYVNNKFPPPATSSYSLQSDNEVKARDLSPSAFPALCGGKGRQSFNDGRRNSTGDVQIPSDLKSQDDCDRESVKSLPATKASNSIETVTSPRINMSYAKMAAGVSSGVHTTSSIGAGNDTSDPKITVWKGSARERRHSIGSSPEGVGIAVSQTPNSSAAMSLKAGSQENLKDMIPDKNLVSGKINTEDNSHDRWNSVGSVERKGSSEGDTEIQIDGKKVKERKNSVKEAKMSASSVVNVHSQPPLLSKTESLANTSVAASDKSDQLKNSGGEPTSEINFKVKSTDSESKVNSISLTTDKQSALIVHKNESQKSKTSSTNNRKHKSVIFYDKRLEETPSSLDISFGFELEPDTLGTIGNSFEVANQELASLGNPSDNLASEKTEINFDNSDLPANNIVQSVSCASITFDSNSTLDQSSIVNVIETSSDSNTDNSNGKENIDKKLNADITEKIDKVSSKLVHLNGIVSPPQGQTSKLVNEVKVDNNSVENETGNQPSTSVQTAINAETHEDTRTEEIYFGENVATLKKDVVGPSSRNGPTSYCGLINFLVEMQTKSNFYLAEAATYLIREWERTLNQQDKDPDSVKVHRE